MKTLVFIGLVLVVVASSRPVDAQSKTYSGTRELLAKMDYSHLDANFKKLFEEALTRKADLIHALYDDEQRVCVNSQIVMQLLAAPDMLSAINEWFEYRKKLGKDYWYPNRQLTSEVKYLYGGRDLAKLVLKNLYPGKKHVSAKLVAYNEALRTMLAKRATK